MYKKNLKKIVLTLCLLLIVPLLTYAQDTLRITVTSDQLQTTALIFAEHKKYSELVPILQQENLNLHTVNNSWIHTDSLKTLQLQKKEQEMLKQAQHIDKVEKNLRITTAVSGTVICVGVLAAILYGCLN